MLLTTSDCTDCQPSAKVESAIDAAPAKAAASLPSNMDAWWDIAFKAWQVEPSTLAETSTCPPSTEA